MVEYSQSSPYYETATFDSRFLDTMVNRTVPARPDDIYTEISATYHLRPDLMAYDLYGSSGLWWVFIARNPNVMQDPIWDFTSGTSIFIPQKKYLVAALGG